MSGVRYCGRVFSPADLEAVRALCADPAHPSRAAIARAVCQALGWHDATGRPKAMSARLALVRMERDGLVTLPPPRNGNANGRWPLRLPPGPLPPPLEVSLSALSPLRLRPVTGKAASRSWNEAVARHHYLGYVPLPGAQRRYVVEGAGRRLALVGLGAAAWACRARDAFIGWEPQARQARLHLVVGNARFLILPWVKVPNLASAVLGLVARHVGPDWEATYGYRPVLLETFVEAGRFAGTSYRAANWIHVGRTTGRGKLDRAHRAALPVKDVYLYPLRRDFRRHLGVSRAGPPGLGVAPGARGRLG